MIPLLTLLLLLNHCIDQSTSTQETSNFADSTLSFNNIMQNVRILAGEESFLYNNENYTIQSRHYSHEDNDISADFIESRLIEYGYEVENQNFSASGRNVIAVKRGSENPEKYFLFGAHYDNKPAGERAPGADDNASGVSAVLEAARLFRNLTSSYSIIFALWDEEEIGLNGSSHFARLAEDSLDILLAINADMIAFDHDDDGIMGLYNSSNFHVMEYVQKFQEINSTKNYDIDLHVMGRSASSDDRAFDNAGISSIGFVEIHFNSNYDEFNFYWHSREDTTDKFNLSFFERMTKLIIYSLSLFAEVHY